MTPTERRLMKYCDTKLSTMGTITKKTMADMLMDVYIEIVNFTNKDKIDKASFNYDEATNKLSIEGLSFTTFPAEPDISAFLDAKGFEIGRVT